jgi:hypothetical protein
MKFKGLSQLQWLNAFFRNKIKTLWSIEAFWTYVQLPSSLSNNILPSLWNSASCRNKLRCVQITQYLDGMSSYIKNFTNFNLLSHVYICSSSMCPNVVKPGRGYFAFRRSWMSKAISLCLFTSNGSKQSQYRENGVEPISGKCLAAVSGTNLFAARCARDSIIASITSGVQHNCCSWDSLRKSPRREIVGSLLSLE